MSDEHKDHIEWFETHIVDTYLRSQLDRYWSKDWHKNPEVYEKIKLLYGLWVHSAKSIQSRIDWWHEFHRIFDPLTSAEGPFGQQQHLGTGYHFRRDNA